MICCVCVQGLQCVLRSCSMCSGPTAERRSYIESIQYLSTLHAHEGSRSVKAGESHVLSKPSTHLMDISMFKDAFGKKGSLMNNESVVDVNFKWILELQTACKSSALRRGAPVLCCCFLSSSCRLTATERELTDRGEKESGGECFRQLLLYNMYDIRQCISICILLTELPVY